MSQEPSDLPKSNAWSQALAFFKSPGFLEKIILLLATALLTGLLVPEISARLADARNRRQKLFEAELQRQRDVIAAQSELLKGFSRLLWEFQLLNINVSFYKANGNEDGYAQAAAKYQARSADLLGQIRAELSAARRLMSPAMHRKLTELYFNTLLSEDANLERLIGAGQASSREDWSAQHRKSFEEGQLAIEGALMNLAREFSLTVPMPEGM